MNDMYDAILFYDELDAEQRAALHAALEADPVLAETFARWRALQADLRRSLDVHLPDRGLLVLYALADDEPDLLLRHEQQALAAARPHLERALQAHPGFREVVQRIRADRAAFDQAWHKHIAAAPPAVPRARAVRGGPPRHGRRASGLRWSWRASVVMTLAAFAAILTLLVQRDRGLVTIETSPGETRLITLADSSTVRLMGGSRLSYAPPEKTSRFSRRARLKGEAFFDIVRNERHFVVETPTALATALGTRFGVQADETMTEVVLAAGKMALAAKAAQEHLVMLEPGQLSRVVEGALPSTPVAVDLAQALAWTGMFIFRATPIEDIAVRLGAYYGIDVLVAPALKGQQVTGSFEHDQPVEQILQTLAATLDAVVRPQAAGGYLLASSARQEDLQPSGDR